MLCLRKHVCSNKFRVRGFVGDDKNLTGPRQEVDADSPNELALCFNNKDVTRTEDFFHGLDGSCSEGHGGNGLSSPDFDDLGSTTFHQGVEQGWVEFAVGPCRCSCENFGHSSGLAKGGGHQSCRYQWRLTPRNINADAVIGSESLTDLNTFGVLGLPVFAHATFGKGMNVSFADSDGFFDVFVNQLVGFVDFSLSDEH